MKAWRFMTSDQHKQMDAKNYPVWGGLSALNVEAIWKGVPGDTPVLHYLRAVSTGPAAPIIVATRFRAAASTPRSGSITKAQNANPPAVSSVAASCTARISVMGSGIRVPP